MNLSLTRVLYKIFVNGFYKVHSGQLLFFFVTIFSYFFYILVLKDNLLTFQQRIEYNLLLVLTMISSPVMAIFMCFLFTIYSFKSWTFVKSQITHPNNFFLFYSANSYSKTSHFKSWFWVQLAIIAPILFFCLFSVVVGVYFGYYLIPFLILTFLIGISVFIAHNHTYSINQPIKSFAGSWIANFSRNYKKPLFSLFIYHIFDSLKITYFVSKALSIGLLIGSLYLFADFKTAQLVAISSIIIALSNSILIFESHQFEKLYLSFQLNFPIRLPFVFIHRIFAFSLLILPEALISVYLFGFLLGLKIVVSVIVMLILLRSILFFTSINMKKYLYFVFGLFIFSILSVQFSIFEIIVLGYLLTSYSIFTKLYYHQT